MVITYLSVTTFNHIRMKPLYDRSDNKLWAHAVDDLEKLRDSIKKFPGIELDVVFEDKADYFDVRHDVEAAPTGLNLERYLSEIPNPENYYYWIDFKNLDRNNENKAVERMKYLLRKFHLADKVIVESPNPDSLGAFSRAGIYTSYWIPHFDHHQDNFFKRISEDYRMAVMIRSTLEQYSFNALSAHYPMYPFINRYFPGVNVHLWTNGLKTESDKKVIRDLANRRNVKVILVDYKENWLSPNSARP